MLVITTTTMTTTKFTPIIRNENDNNRMCYSMTTYILCCNRYSNDTPHSMQHNMDKCNKCNGVSRLLCTLLLFNGTFNVQWYRLFLSPITQIVRTQNTCGNMQAEWLYFEKIPFRRGLVDKHSTVNNSKLSKMTWIHRLCP